MKYCVIKHYPVIALVIIGWLLSACSHQELNNFSTLNQRARDLASMSDLLPETAIDEAKKILVQAKKQELDFFVPLHFQQAKSSLANAERLLNDGESISKVMEAAFQVQSLIADGYNVKTMVAIALSDIVAYRLLLHEINSPQLLPDAYAETMASTSQLIELIEQGKMDQAKQSQEQIIAQMRLLEVATLKQSHLSEAQKILQQAKRIEAPKYAAVTYEEAQQALADSQDYIEKNPRNRSEITLLGKKVLAAAHRAFNVANEAAGLVDMEPEQAEKRVHYLESILAKLRESLKEEDASDKTLEEQVEGLIIKSNQLYQSAQGSTINDAAESEDTLQFITEEEMIQKGKADNSDNELQVNKNKHSENKALKSKSQERNQQPQNNKNVVLHPASRTIFGRR